MSLQALNYHVVGKAIIEKKTKSGIITSANKVLYPMKCRVLSIGPDVKADIKVGDIVIFPTFKNVSIKIDGEEFSVIHCKEIKAVLHDK